MATPVMPFVDLTRQLAAVRAEVDDAVRRVLDSGVYILGPEVSAFEAELATFVGARFCVGVANGTEAIAIALMACGIGPGDEVITTDLTAYPTVTGICMSGAVPVAADIDAESGLLDPVDVEAKITAATKALLPVHLYGQACDLTRLQEIARAHRLVLVEDCAQAIGARWRGRAAGTVGDAGCFSFYPTKNLGALGDAGAVVTDSADLAARARMLRNYGQTDRYHHATFGINSRLSELQAALLRVKLRHLPEWTERRRAIASAYRAGMTGLDLLPDRDGNDGVWHLFPVRTRDRDGFMARMLERGVPTLIHYPVPVSRQPAFPGPPRQTPTRSDVFAAEVASLPLYPELSPAEVERVIAAANESAPKLEAAPTVARRAGR